MRLRLPARPRKGAFFLSALALASASLQPVAAQVPPSAQAPVGRVASNFEQLRVTEVADQLIRYLGTVLQWVDQPDTRAPTLVLAGAVRSAVLAHPEVRLSQEQRETASQATREAYAGFLPQVSANADGGRRRFDAINTPWSNVPAHDDNSRALAISARQLLYDFGAVSSQVDARTALEAAAAARAEVKRSELGLRALTAWSELFRAQQGVVLSNMNTASRQQILSFIEERETLGGSPQSDVLRARARLADAQVAAVAAQNRLTGAEAVYREVFDQPAPAEVRLPAAVPVALERYANLEQWITRSPHLAEARAQTEAAGHEAKAAAAALLPSLHLDLSLRRRDIGGEGVAGNDWTAGLMLKQNLYSGGADLARKRQADQRAKEGQLGEDNVRRQLERAFAQATAEVRNSVAAVAARKDAAQVAAVALAAVREQFAFRRGTLLDLLRAQEELYGAGRELIDGVVDDALVRFRLLHLAADLSPMFDLPGSPGVTK